MYPRTKLSHRYQFSDARADAAALEIDSLPQMTPTITHYLFPKGLRSRLGEEMTVVTSRGLN